MITPDPVISRYRAEGRDTAHPRAWGAPKHCSWSRVYSVMHGPQRGHETNTLTTKSQILGSDDVPATTTPAASCGLQMTGLGSRKVEQTQGSAQTLQPTRSWLGGARAAQGTRNQPAPSQILDFRFWWSWLLQPPTPLATGLWMERLGWSMIQKKIFSSGVYRVLGCVKISKM